MTLFEFGIGGGTDLVFIQINCIGKNTEEETQVLLIVC